MDSEKETEQFRCRSEFKILDGGEDFGLSPEQLKFVRKAFRNIDENGDGKLSVEEFERASRVLGYNPTRKEVEEMMKKEDTDGNGFLDFKEFALMMKNDFGAQDYQEYNLKEYFKILDADGNGYIDYDELATHMTRAGQDPLDKAEFERVIKDLDADNDGKIEYDELAKKLCEMPKWISLICILKDGEEGAV